VRHEQELQAAFSQQAPYLFHAGEGERNWDQGLRSFTCSRRIDAFKVWVAIQRYGASGLGLLYDHLCATARALHDAVRARPRFQALHAPESNILCFRFVGDRWMPDDRVDDLNVRLRTTYNRDGDGWITGTVLGGRRVLRVTLMNPRTTPGDLERVLDGLEAIGGSLLRAS
jgi:L-2,4-diaminobutyrate decarboxylase